MYYVSAQGVDEHMNCKFLRGWRAYRPKPFLFFLFFFFINLVHCMCLYIFLQLFVRRIVP